MAILDESTWPRRLQRRVAARLAGQLVLRPTREVIDHGGQTRHVIHGDHVQIECFVHRTAATSDPTGRRDSAAARHTADAAADGPQQNDPPPDLLVIKLPGTAGRAERSTPQPADLLPQWRSEVWTWNPPGYGGSRGTLSLADMPAAAAVFYDYVVGKRAAPGTRVWIVGNSLGCATALYLASVRDPHALMLRNPPPLTKVIPHVAAGHRWPRLAVPLARMIAAGIPEAMDALRTAPLARAPALFLQSDEDTLIPPSMQAMVRDAYGGPQRLIRLVGLNHHQPLADQHLQPLREGIAWLVGTSDPASVD